MPSSLLLPLFVGGAAIFLLLPRPRGFPTVLGALAGLVALVLIGRLFVAEVGLSIETFLFLVFAAMAVLAGSLLITQQNPARAALSFAVVVLSTCGLFLLLAAPFLMAATVIVYAGAIVVTFLFVIMLAQQEGLSDADARSREPLLATVTGFVLLGALLYVFHITYSGSDNGKLVEELLAEVRRAETQLAAGQTTGLDKLPDRLLERVNQVAKEGEKIEEDKADGDTRAIQMRLEFAREVRRRIETVAGEFPDSAKASPAAIQEALAKLAKPLIELRQEQGLLRPGPTIGDAMSPLSGTPANTPAEEMRLDDDGRPRLPAENTQYLGRSLFTDFLLPVELGGTLLLVATIGAIAIAQRRTPQGRAT